MNKPYLVISCPIATVSGYGEHSRDLLRSLKEMDKFEIGIVSQPWGKTPMNALSENNEYHKWLVSKMVSIKDGKLQVPKKPDIWIQVTVPNEFQPIGNYNIGITAGVETNLVHQDFILGMNRMDLNIVTSEHTKDAFLNSIYIQKNEADGTQTPLKIEKPIKVLFEGVDTDTYINKMHDLNDTLLHDELSKIKENFVFLFVGHWLHGDIGHDRKDIGTLIKAFCQEFRTKSNKPALLLKTSAGNFSKLDRQSITKKINEATQEFGKNCPPIYLMHGELTNEEMNNLYNHPKIKAMVSFTKGEGFGRPLLEFTQTGKPIIAPNWGGQLDFLNSIESVLIGGEVKQIHKSAVWDKFLIPESKWFYVNINEGRKALEYVFKNYNDFSKRSISLMKKNREQFSLQKMTELFQTILDENVPQFPTEVKLDLPKLKKLQLPNLNKDK